MAEMIWEMRFNTEHRGGDMEGIKKAVADGYIALALAQHFYRIPSDVIDKIIEEQLTKEEAKPK